VYIGLNLKATIEKNQTANGEGLLFFPIVKFIDEG